MKQKPISELLEFCIINVDKPSGPTSFDVCDKVRKILNAKKAGHFGTLDPKVTGVLPVAINRACKLSNYFMKKDKEYVGKMHVHKEIDKEKLEKEMNRFIGKIMQKPPVKSRVRRVLRERIVNRFEIKKIKKAKKGMIVEFHSDVQAGTYIRKLVSDLGELVGGAHMIELRRIRAGIFKEKDSHSLEEIKEAFEEYKEGKEANKASKEQEDNEAKLRRILLPAEIIKQIITGLQVKEESVKGLLNGKPLMKEDIKGKVPNSELFSVFAGERFIGIYKAEGKDLEKKSKDLEIIARPEFVKN
jgi:H/ACA ribonucleoprotein complex subunit 4